MEAKRRFIFGGIIFLVSSISFAAGYLAGRDGSHTPIVIEACSAVASSSLMQDTDGP